VSSPEVEFVQRWYEAFNGDDTSGWMDAVREMMHPEFEADMSRRVFNPAHYRGMEDVQRFLDEMEEIWTGAQVEVEEIRQQHERVLVLNRFSARGTGSGVQVQRSSAHLWFFQDGLVRGFVLYPDREEARAAFASPAG
jgi:hypothetical protein